LHGAENREFQGRVAGFVEHEAYTNVRTLSKKKKSEITNTKFDTKVNIYLGLLQGPCMGPVQVRGPQAEASLPSW
jgi:hypothetical protein